MTLLKRIVLEKRTLITIVVMVLAVDVLLYAFAVYPWSNKVVRAETRAVQAAAQLGLLRASYVAATQASENKINADSQLERFYSEVLPVDLAGARRISNPLLAKLAADTNLVLEQRRSVSETIRESLLARLRTTMVLAGAYEDIRQFIYELETAPEFIVIEAVILSQADGSDEELVLTLGVSTYYWKELTQRDLSPIHIGNQTNFGLTGAPPLIAAQPDAGVPDARESDAGVPDTTEPDADVPDVDAVLPEPAPPVERVPAPPTPEPAAPVEPEPALPPPSDQPQTLPALPEPSVAGQVLVTPPGAVFRVGGGPYTVPVSIAGVSQLSTISLTLFFDPNVLRVRTVQAGGGTFMSQGGLEVSFSQEVDTAAGRIDITATRNNDATGASGAGLLAAVLFDAVGVGSITLTTSGTALTPGGAPLALQFRPATVTVQ